MSDSSVSSIQLPRLRRTPRRDSVARHGLLRLLGRLQTGSLTVHEGDRTLHIGAAGARGVPHAVINIHDPATYRQVLAGGTVGAGEAFMQGHWSSPDPVEVIRLFCANMVAVQAMDSGLGVGRTILSKALHFLNRNTLSGARRNIAAHYDLGNEFFALFLDPTMMYSAAVFPRADASLEEASLHKLELLCGQLELRPEDHLLEIGTGWGGLAIHAAREYGCRVTTTTLSREQYEYALERVRTEGLQERVTVLCEDYRNLQGRYDKLVSVEMIEAVGAQYYGDYFRKCTSLLAPDGLMVIQAITVPDQRYEQARDEVDFIKRYIFPGGCLPSLETISHHVARDTDMQALHLRDITLDYADTLACWRERFLAALPQVREQGFDEVFQRMWEFYLCYCEGAFRERVIGTVQLTLARPGYRPRR